MGEDGEVSGMAMTVIWTGMVVVSILCGLATGNGPAVAAAAMEGAAAAVELCLSMAGVLCLWMGVMEVMRRSGLSDGLSRLPDHFQLRLRSRSRWGRRYR